MTLNNQDYNDYSALDAPPHLTNVLQQFFDHKRNAYKFALAKQHFENVKLQDDFVSAARLFKIVTGTNLVTNKEVLH